jgi:predicted metalloprotease with PDZ domain
MNRWAKVIAVVAAVALASPLMAGEGHKCTHATQECLDYMAANFKDRGWVGIEMDDSGGHMVVTKVVDSSPAEKAGFKKGDLLLAVNGVEFAEAHKDKIKKVQSSMKPGVEMVYTVKRGTKKKELDVTLAKIPDTVMAQWVGSHMVNDHAEIQLASK